MVSHGTLFAQKGKVHLIERPDLPIKIDEHEGSIWLLCQQLTYKMEKEGIEGCATVIANMYGSNAERAKDLAYRLYTIAERKKWAQEAYAYNALVVAWPEIQSRAAELKAIVPQQLTLEDFMKNNN
jgi:putative DNA methylase